jgi:glutathione peroxidase-family protein
LYDKYHDRGFTILAVNAWNEDAKTLKQFAKTNELRYPILLKGGNTAEDWGVAFLPTNFLIDRSGKVVGKYGPIADKGLARLEKKIEHMLK